MAITTPPLAKTESLPALLRALPTIASCLCVCVGILVLIGWSFDIESFKRVWPGFVAMNPLTAVCFILSGAALTVFLRLPTARWGVGVTRLLALLIMWIGAVKLTSLLGKTPYLIDTWLFTSKLGSMHDQLPNRMAPNAAMNFIVTGLALFSLHLPKSRLWLAQSCAILVGFGGVLPLAGYAYGVDTFTGFASFIPMALHTALTFLILAVGVFFAIPEAPLPQIFASGDPRGVIARRLVPLSVLFTLFLGWLRLWGERRGYYESEFGTLLFAISLSLIFVVLVRWTLWTVGHLERERAETQARLAEMNRRKDEIYAVVSHDLCSPLTGFRMVIDMLRAEEGKPPDDLLDLMDHATRRMVSMVRGLFDATRQQQPDEVRLEYSELRVSDVVRESIEPLLINANAKHIRVQIDVASDEPPIHADHLRISQIFNNLLSNAVKFTGEGGSVVVKIEPAFAGVRVEVKDSGMGISEKDLPHVFDKYYQGSAQATAGEPGSGLGLAVAREMALLHNGYIEVASNFGKSSTFTVYLPVGLHAVAA
ncbi:MAG: sensor histidine kinase [Chthoniobacterales bacterium]